MWCISLYLRWHGYAVVAVSYPSTRASIPVLARYVRYQCHHHGVSFDDAALSVVTHSMGGILLRELLRNTSSSPGCVVMLGPPQYGSVVVDHLRSYRWFARCFGPAALQLASDSSYLSSLPVPQTDIGVIAGNAALLPVFTAFFDEPNDGKVSVVSTEVEGMKDHIVLSVGHTRMLLSITVCRQMLHFLRQRKFDHHTAIDD